ncbi:MAG: histidine decarboxylase [Pelagibacterales bacterium]|nr:histidine decarboxylase [Pelagibacterales bacterium]
MTNNFSNPDFPKFLENYIGKVKDRAKNFLGYPVSIDFNYSDLFELLNYPLNNLGDPLIESTYDLNSRSIEREVVKFFAEIFKAPKENSWGYVTNGGSEGNLYALYVARELYPNGMVYYSEATHYSIQKNINLLNMPSIVIRAKDNGEMDYEDLKDAVHTHRDRPAIVVANIGTTMTEAKDDIAQIKKALKNSAIRSHYIHADGALAGTYLALLGQGPKFDFENGADSVAISGHKFIGSPIPCGVVVVKKNYKDRIGQAIPYIGTMDTTITGSRNGHSPVFLWYAINKMGLDGLRRRAEICLDVAEYLESRLKEKGIDAWRNDHAITVVFPKPKQEVVVKWQLASEGNWSHIICMPGVTKEKIDEFLKDLNN